MSDSDDHSNNSLSELLLDNMCSAEIFTGVSEAPFSPDDMIFIILLDKLFKILFFFFFGFSLASLSLVADLKSVISFDVVGLEATWETGSLI